MKKHLTNASRFLLLSSLAGLVAGITVSLFLWSLQKVVDFKITHEVLIYFLPLAGLLLGRMKEIEAHLILEEVHSPKELLPIKLGPQIWFSTLLSHFFGASVGREGAATQIGASFANQIARLFKLEPHERRGLIVCGLGAGLSAAIGTPWAGAIFGLELFRMRNMSFSNVFESIASSFIAFNVSLLIFDREPLFRELPALSISPSLFAVALGAGVLFGILAFSFEKAHHGVSNAYSKFKVGIPWRPVIGGAVFVLIIKCFSLEAYEGLSLQLIRDAFSTSFNPTTPIIKLLLTALVLGSGFRGGEFIPLVVIGTTTGAWLETQLHTGTLMLPALGYGVLFGCTGRVPIAAAVMTVELFGLDIGVYALLCGAAAYGVKRLLDAKLNPT